MSNFSFSRIVFKGLALQTRKSQSLFGKGLKVGYFNSSHLQKKVSTHVSLCIPRRLTWVASFFSLDQFFPQHVQWPLYRKIQSAIWQKETESSHYDRTTWSLARYIVSSKIWPVFSSFPTMFSTLAKKEIIISALFNLSSARCFKFGPSQKFSRLIKRWNTNWATLCIFWANSQRNETCQRFVVITTVK